MKKKLIQKKRRETIFDKTKMVRGKYHEKSRPTTWLLPLIAFFHDFDYAIGPTWDKQTCMKLFFKEEYNEVNKELQRRFSLLASIVFSRQMLLFFLGNGGGIFSYRSTKDPFFRFFPKILSCVSISCLLLLFLRPVVGRKHLSVCILRKELKRGVEVNWKLEVSFFGSHEKKKWEHRLQDPLVVPPVVCFPSLFVYFSPSSLKDRCRGREADVYDATTALEKEGRRSSKKEAEGIQK